MDYKELLIQQKKSRRKLLIKLKKRL